MQVLKRSSKIVKTAQGRFIQQALTLSSALQLLQTSTECNNNLNNAHALDERLRSGCGDMLRLSALPRTCPTCVLSPLVINSTVFIISGQLYIHIHLHWLVPYSQSMTTSTYCCSTFRTCSLDYSSTTLHITKEIYSIHISHCIAIELTY